jgi:predicted acetyltransferase
MSLITHLLQKVGQPPGATKPALLRSKGTFTHRTRARQQQRVRIIGMVAPVSLVRLTEEDPPVVERLWQLYAHDLSDARGSKVNDQGLYKAGRLPGYFDNVDAAGYLIRRDSVLAGFVFVVGLTDVRRMIGDFFVVRGERRRNVGLTAALAALQLYPGDWDIAFQENNIAAAQFWRRVANQAAGTAWTEQSRPVLGKPEIRPDTWLQLTI